ncbi:MAG: 3'-5' exonuclease [Flavobacteriaceae bacterium]|nr:3'-5' exonuclease [Flavobacteriaceae bacterium]
MNIQNKPQKRDLYLTNPLCILDLETTGLDVKKDRIVQIGILKLSTDRTKPDQEYSQLLNPEMSISPESVEVHNITEQMVENMPTFRQKALEIFDFIKGCDLCGFNLLRFDLRLLALEFYRVGFREFDFKKVKIVDVKNIFHTKEPRTLSAAVEFYCHKKFENAHDALEDVKATKAVLIGQLNKYQDIEPNVDYLEKKFSPSTDYLDLGFQIKKNSDGKACFDFGKHKGKTITEVIKKDRPYINWIFNRDFHETTVQIIKDHLYNN